MLTDLAPPQIRGITGLELAAGVFTKCSDGLATQLQISLTSGKRESGPMPFRLGINGDVYGGMRAPIEVGTRRVDIAYVNPAAMVAMAYRGKGSITRKSSSCASRLFPVLGPHRLGGRQESRREIVARYRAPQNSAACFDAYVRSQQRHLLSPSRRFYLSMDCRSIKSKAGAGGCRNARGRLRRRRSKAIAKRSITAVFDEGVSTAGGWLDQALGNGYEIIPIEPDIVKKLEQMGYTQNGAAQKAAIGSSRMTR